MTSLWKCKCLVVAGVPGVGKTTLIINVLDTLRASFPTLNIYGFYSREIRQGSERLGFEGVTVGGRSAPFAHSTTTQFESISWPRVGKYKVDVEAFESLVLPELQGKDDADLFVIDEVGKMELYSSYFFPAVMRLLESGVPVLATIPSPTRGRDMPGVARLRNHPGVQIFTLDMSNRDTMKEHLLSHLLTFLQKPH